MMSWLRSWSWKILLKIDWFLIFNCYQRGLARRGWLGSIPSGSTRFVAVVVVLELTSRV
jgi:hypothetical protein